MDEINQTEFYEPQISFSNFLNDFKILPGYPEIAEKAIEGANVTCRKFRCEPS